MPFLPQPCTFKAQRDLDEQQHEGFCLRIHTRFFFFFLSYCTLWELNLASCVAVLHLPNSAIQLLIIELIDVVIIVNVYTSFTDDTDYVNKVVIGDVWTS